MDRAPLISVIMSVYNEEKYIKEALESILNQTEGDFELIIIDDSSTDTTGDIIRSIRDDRITYVLNGTNQGLTKNLNKALLMAKGKYIARMDGDDISLPERFKTEVAFLESHPEVMLISCRTTTFGEENLISDIQGSGEELKCRMLLRPVLAHPGFMFRRELYEEKGYSYDEHFRSAQDYDFAARVTRQYNIGIVPEVLLKYRAHKGQVSQTPNLKQFGFADEIRNRLFMELDIDLKDQSLEDFHQWVLEKSAESSVYEANRNLLLQILEKNSEKNIYDGRVLEKVLWQQYFQWMLRAGGSKNVIRICRGHKGAMGYFVNTLADMVKSKLDRSIK